MHKTFKQLVTILLYYLLSYENKHHFKHFHRAAAY